MRFISNGSSRPAILGCGSRVVHHGLGLLCLLVLGALPVRAQDGPSPIPLHAPVRPTVSTGSGGATVDLAGDWSLLVDPGATGLLDGWADALGQGLVPDGAPAGAWPLLVPGPLEALDQTRDYDGVAWLVRRFTLDASAHRDGSTWELRFGQVNYAVRVWLDGLELGGHEGGYDAFSLPLPAAPEPGEHVLVLRVVDPGALRTDGLSLATTPHAKESWYHNFGGVLGDVTLVRLDAPLAELARLSVDSRRQQVVGRVTLRGPPSAEAIKVTLHLAPLALGEAWPSGRADEGLTPTQQSSTRVAFDAGRAEVELLLGVPEPRRWSPDAPHRYVVWASVDGRPAAPEGCRAFGFRELSLDADGLHLNGRRIMLKGVLDQPHHTGTGGVTPDASVLEAKAQAMLDTGFNLVRAHVRPAPPAFLEACDRLGLMVLEEPAIGWVRDEPALVTRLAHEIDWMVARDHHHPSIVMWGVLNEMSGEAWHYGDELMSRLAAADPTRPVLLDSGGFLGRGSYIDAGGSEARPMIDEHVYPPWPLPREQALVMTDMAADAGPTFVSEFGFGSLVDVDGAVAGFSAAGLRDAEAAHFRSQQAAARRARESGEGWSDVGWIEESRGLQATAALEMTERLRANPALDLLCYTQWQAVSRESSAGLLDPWGPRRPAWSALRHALRPVAVIALPQASSVTVGSELSVDVCLVNDSGQELEGRLELLVDGLADGAQRLTVPTRRWSAGVTPLDPSRFTLRVDRPGTLRLTAALLLDEAVLDTSRTAEVAVLPTPPAHRALNLGPARASEAGPAGAVVRVSLYDPADDPDVAAFAARQGFALRPSLQGAGADDTVLLVAHPERLHELPVDERLALWSHVWAGGAALLLLPDPSDTDIGRLMGGARGRVGLPDVPVPVTLASAGGNFMGRVYPLLEAVDPAGSAQAMPAFAEASTGAPILLPRDVTHPGRPAVDPTPRVRLLSAFEGDLTPHAMLVGDLPSGSRPLMLVLGPIGDRLGVAAAAVPYGQGTLAFVGLPLLEPVAGGPEPRRDAWLSHLVLELAAERVAARRGPGAPARFAPVVPSAMADEEREAIETVSARVREVSALVDRWSVVHGGTQRPPPELEQAFEAWYLAIEALARDRRADAREKLLEALTAAWSDETAAFLALEQQVLAGVAGLMASSSETDLIRAQEVIGCWQEGVVEWFAGRRETAFAWMGRAELALRDSGSN